MNKAQEGIEKVIAHGVFWVIKAGKKLEQYFIVKHTKTPLLEDEQTHIQRATIQQTIRITPEQKELVKKTIEKGEAAGVSDAIRRAIDNTYKRDNKVSIGKHTRH